MNSDQCRSKRFGSVQATPLKSIFRWLTRVTAPSTLVVGLSLFAGLVLAQPYSQSDTLDPSIQLSSLPIEGHTLSYAYSGAKEKPGVLFIHGTPGGWGAFEVFLLNKQLQHNFFMVSVDRLGWGQSVLPANMIDGDFDLQARSIAALMAAYPDKRWILVGHSLGASIAPKIALKAPQAVSSLLLLAGTLDPELGKPRWYNRMANTWVVSKLIGKSMRYSNREIMSLHDQSVIMNQAINSTKLASKLVVMQGMKDRLVSPKNPAFVKTQWMDNFREVAFIELAGEGHFLPWRQTPLVIETIYQLAEDSLEKPSQAD